MRALSTLSHQNMVTEVELLFSGNGAVIQRTSNGSEMMKESTATRMMYFFMHLLHLLQLSASSNEKSSRSRKESEASTIKALSGDLSGSASDKTTCEAARSESAVSAKRNISRSSFVTNEIINQELL